ncbi:MAG: RidA family protein [Thermoanaerobaculia bacterium]
MDMAKLPFSPVRSAGDSLFLSGQVGQKDGKLVSSDLKEQVRQAVANVEFVLASQGMSLSDVVDVLAFLVNADDYGPFNEIYAELFQEPRPTRTCIGVAWLPLGAKVEITARAARDLK